MRPNAATPERAVLMPTRDPRLIPYCAITVVALAAAVVMGRPALVAVAAPFALVLAAGLRRTAPVHVRAGVTLDTDRVLEGDIVVARVELEWDADLDAEAMLHRLKGVVPSGAAHRSWTTTHPARSLILRIQFRATQWGRHSIGEVWLRLRTRHGLLTWTGRVARAPALRVLPASERLARLLDPAEYRSAMGMHVSRRLGDGHEFAELRPYTPGDRLRDLNWTATARRGRPLVNRHHAEQSGDVVIALDTFADDTRSSTEALARAARAAWTVASIHLAAHDRVGLAGLGGRTRWLPPASGRRAKYQLLETLLDVGGDAISGSAGLVPAVRSTVPASALVVAITPLHDDRPLASLQSWRAHGRAVSVIVIDTTDLLDDPAAAAEALARRIWQIELDRRRRRLTELGIPVVTLAGDGTMRPVISALRRARRAAISRSRA